MVRGGNVEFSVFAKIADKFGTPVFVYFENILKSRAKSVWRAFEGMNLVPTAALKANNNPVLLSILREEGFGGDVVTPGELYAALKAEIDPSKIVWNGNGKTQKQKDFFMKKGVKVVNVDSIEEYEKLWKGADGVDLFLRINPDVEAHTHKYISTGKSEHKFGVHYKKAVEFLDKEGKKFKGLHIHIGSQITEATDFENAYEVVAEVSKKFGFAQVNIGGGWGINYGDGQELDLDEYRKIIQKMLKDFEKIYIELGRYIYAPAGVLLARVHYVKEGMEKNFIVLDTGMSHVIRPALYSAKHGVEFSEYTDKEGLYDVVGYLCETGDFIRKGVEGKLPKEGSLAVVKDVGAYGYSMASNYNSIPKPPEVLVREDGTIKLIRKGEALEEMFQGVVF